MRKLLVLKLDGDLEKVVRVTLAIEEENNRLGMEVIGYLPANPNLALAIDNWRENYLSAGKSSRVQAVGAARQWRYDCNKSANELRQSLNQWLLSESFRPIRDKCLQYLIPDNEVRVLIRTSSQSLLKLPWHLWDLIDGNSFSEVALSTPNAEFRPTVKTPTLPGKVKILAILGNSTGIDIQQDRQVLENLLNAETTFLVEPKRQEINDYLWEKSWDILFFAGHSGVEGESGRICINQTESLTIDELRYALRNAVNNGLQLAIFNSCEGMELAFELQQLHIPQIIVMREPVPDVVAQAFVTYFLPAFASGKPLYLAEREARLRLHGLEYQFPCASWLPAIFQNPATVPPRWKDLGRRPTDKCPYRGLFAFREEDAPFFFGRESFSRILVEAVHSKPLVAVIGSSGSGKSSVVFAGLIPHLRQEGHWRIVSFRPGAKPFHALAAALISQQELQIQSDQLEEITQLADYLRHEENSLHFVLQTILRKNSGTRLLLVADQFEELYTLCQDTQKRQVFLDRLIEATHLSNFTVMLTLRADFLAQSLSYRPFADALQYRDLKLGPMNREELQATVEKPAGLFGVTLESGLTERIIEAVSVSVGDLPLLEFALQELWAKQSNAQLRHATYNDIGGVKTAVASYAEQVYARLNESEKEQARRIFLQLVRLGEGTEETRRLATREEVGNGNWNLVIRLASDRLVVTGRDDATGKETVEIVHEALIREWERLRQWIELDRDFQTWLQGLRSAMYQWHINGRDDDSLLRGKPLADAEEWMQKRASELVSERAFIEASLGLRHRERKQRDRLRRGIVLGLAGSLVVALMFAGAAGVAWWRTNISETNAKIKATSASARAIFASNLQLEGLTSSLEAAKQLRLLEKSDNAEPDTKIEVVTALQQILYGTKELNHLTKHSAAVWGVSFSPDGQILASASADKTINLWQRDGSSIATLDEHGEDVYSVSFSPDGQTIASASDDKTVKLWQVSDGSLITTLSGHTKGVRSVSFSPDGQTIASASFDKTIKLWKKSSEGKFQSRPYKTLIGHQDEVLSVSFSPDGQTIASASKDKTIKIWKAIDGSLVTSLSGHNAEVRSVAFSPDGRTLASVGDDKTLKLWNSDGTLSNTIFTGCIEKVTSVRFSRDGQIIASTCWDGSVKLWRRDGSSIATLNGHTAGVTDISFHPYGAIATASADGVVQLWSTRSNFINTLSGHNQAVRAIAFSPDGQTIASGSNDKTIKVWKTSDRTLVHTLTGHQDAVRGVTFSPDGEIIASTSADKTIKLWRAKDGSLIDTLTGHQDEVRGVVFSRDGQIIASGSSDGTVKLWRRNRQGKFETQSYKTITGHTKAVRAVAFSPDGQIIASASWDGTVKLWRRNGSLIATLEGHNAKVYTVTFSPDGETIATASDDNTIKLWRASDGSLVTTLRGHSAAVYSVSFSPDGQTLASVGVDKTVKIWRRDGILITALTGHTASVTGVSFSPDGQTIASASDDKTVILWNLNLDDLLKRGCNWTRSYLKNPNNGMVQDDYRRRICDDVY
ncbi:MULTISPECIES: nSTAND1 domain-containing NTPase [Nostocales]|uniref:CHAT domain-containing protein n=4 Tax=Nostocales TaxID=1161 RepID=A0A8S9T785_9CYAN|nr:CHAT domain-containing protein [Tolypothrix bouteillei]KAF3888330.1 CHAT domain-containing protein [Tolypothrix bouteillei VB521301]